MNNITKNINDPDKLQVWKTSAVVDIHKELPVTRVPVPSERSVEIAKEFVDENEK